MASSVDGRWFPGRSSTAVGPALVLLSAWASLAIQAGCGTHSDGTTLRDAGGEGPMDAQAGPDASRHDARMGDAGRDGAQDADQQDAGRQDADQQDADLGPCGADMVQVGSICMDRYEAPNRRDALPLVMYSFDEAASWCAHRGKRLCFDDEWTEACAGASNLAYPYGDEQQPGRCNDDKTWKVYNQDLLNQWPWNLDTDPIESLAELLDLVRAQSAQAAQAADHVQALYQGDPSGSHGGCVSSFGVFDTEGNVEEWTRRRDGGQPGFHGNLKGRYWAEPRTCQSNVTVHGDTFRFYEIGFRCCWDLP